MTRPSQIRPWVDSDSVLTNSGTRLGINWGLPHVEFRPNYHREYALLFVILGMSFGPVKHLKEVITWRICMPFWFWSTRIFRRNLWSRDLKQYKICSQVIIKFGGKLGWTEIKMACICVTWLPPSNDLLDQKIIRPRSKILSSLDRSLYPWKNIWINL